MWLNTLSFVVSIGALLSSIAAVATVSRCYRKLRSPSMLQSAQQSAAILELTDSFNALQKSLETLRSRIGMRELREKRAAGQSSGQVDSSTSNGAISRDELRRRAGIMPGLPAKHSQG